MDFGSKAVKVGCIFGNPVVVLHNQIFDCVFGVALGVMRAKMLFEFLLESGIVILPCWQK
jgi:hypothetical protein